MWLKYLTSSACRLIRAIVTHLPRILRIRSVWLHTVSSRSGRETARLRDWFIITYLFPFNGHIHSTVNAFAVVPSPLPLPLAAAICLCISSFIFPLYLAVCLWSAQRTAKAPCEPFLMDFELLNVKCVKPIAMPLYAWQALAVKWFSSILKPKRSSINTRLHANSNKLPKVCALIVLSISQVQVANPHQIWEGKTYFEPHELLIRCNSLN